MEKFLFIPPIDESMPPLKPGQWVWIAVSFLVSLILFVFFIMMAANHVVVAMLAVFALSFTTFPMKMYAMNRRGRSVGKLFLIITWAIVIYTGWGWIKKHTSDVLFVGSIAASVVWLTYCIDKVGNTLMERLNNLHRRINSVEIKIDGIGRRLRKMKAETAKIPIE